MKKLDVRLRFCLILTGPECCSSLAEKANMYFYVCTHLPVSEPAEKKHGFMGERIHVRKTKRCAHLSILIFIFLLVQYFSFDVWVVGIILCGLIKNTLFTTVTISMYNLIAKIRQPRLFRKQKITDIHTCRLLLYHLQDQICQIIVELIIDFMVHGWPIWQEFLLINTFGFPIYFYIEINKNKVLYCFSLAIYKVI